MPCATQSQIGRSHQEAIVHLWVVFDHVEGQHGTAYEAQSPVDPGHDHGKEGHDHDGLPGFLFVGPTRETVQQPSDRR